MPYDPTVFTIRESLDPGEFIFALYYLEGAASDLLRKAGGIAIGQTTGTWVPVSQETPELRRTHVGRVVGVYEIPAYEDRLPSESAERRFLVQAAFPVANFDDQLAALLVMVFGKVSMAGRIKLLDLTLPEKYARRFAGPKFGIEGVRELLGVERRPLLMSIFKPCLGLSPKQLGDLFFEQARGGVDLVKDDEILPDIESAPFEARLEACLQAAARAKSETGQRTLYAINLTGSPDAIFAKAQRAVSLGATALLINVLAVGFDVVRALTSDASIKVPVLAHPAMAGAFYPSPVQGISSELVLGKLVRLAGGDLSLFPSAYGTVPLLRERTLRIGQQLTSPFYHLRRAFPVPSAGIHPGLVPRLIDDFGLDVVINAGGGVHGHPQGTAAGGRAFRQAIEATLVGRSLEDASRDHAELRAAYELWGTRAGVGE